MRSIGTYQRPVGSNRYWRCLGSTWRTLNNNPATRQSDVVVRLRTCPIEGILCEHMNVQVSGAIGFIDLCSERNGREEGMACHVAHLDALRTAQNEQISSRRVNECRLTESGIGRAILGRFISPEPRGE
jgi:hypothetical protein